jgi:hypothetical protein
LINAGDCGLYIILSQSTLNFGYLFLFFVCFFAAYTLVKCCFDSVIALFALIAAFFALLYKDYAVRKSYPSARG